MSAKKLCLFLTLMVVAAISATILRAQAPEQEAAQQESSNRQCGWLCQFRERQAQRLEGSWAMTVTAVVPPGVPPPPVRNNYTTFTRGGGAIGSDRQAPFSNPQHGVWEYVRGNEYAYTFVSDGFDAAGNFQGTLKARFKITLTGRDEFIGVDNAELRDAAGNLVFSRCNTIRGQRIRIEPLPAQCQGIIPPQ